MQKRIKKTIVLLSLLVLLATSGCSTGIQYAEPVQSDTAGKKETIGKISILPQEKKKRQLTAVIRTDGKDVREYFLSYNEKGLLTDVKEYDDYDRTDCVYWQQMNYDTQDRMIEKWLPVSWPSGPIGAYTYREDGKLLAFFSAEGGTTEEYFYDENGVNIRKEMMLDEGPEVWEHTYDEEGQLVSSQVTRRMLGTTYLDDYRYVYDEQGRLSMCDYTSTGTPCQTHYEYQYLPFWVVTHKIPSDESVFIELVDSQGHMIWSLAGIYNPRYYRDEEGYLTKIISDNWNDQQETFYFLYDGEELTEPVQSKAGKLSYPIQEEDCYIIYRNYFGYEMKSSDDIQIVIDRLDGEQEKICFAIYKLNPNTQGYTIQGDFEVDVNTGVCTRGDITFQADDYYW